MRLFKLSLILTLIALPAYLIVQNQKSNSEEISEKEAIDIATEAYIYGYPLVTMDLTKKVMTNTVKADSHKAPINQFANLREYPTASFRDVTAPNADTLYSSAWLDLSKGPLVLQVPNEKGRYYLMPLLSGWTNVFAAPGTRTTGTEAESFAITGPNWAGTLPDNVKEIKSPTNMVWLLGRTYSTGTTSDYQAVHALQDQYKLTPLSSFGKPYTPPDGIYSPGIDTKTPVREQVNKLDGPTFFKNIARLLKDNPPAKEDAPMVAKLAKLGIHPGEEFNIRNLNPHITKAISLAPKLGLEKIAEHEKTIPRDPSGWVFSAKTGSYGTNYLERAFVAAVGLGANLPQDAIYPYTHMDSEGQPLDGKNDYVIHFAKGKTPPVKGFWSLTMYDDKYFFVANPLHRYTLSPRNNFKYNEDGSLDLYIQNSNPGPEKESNWLPAPSGPFILMFRFYWPEDAIIDGSWTPPPVKLNKVEAPISLREPPRRNEPVRRNQMNEVRRRQIDNQVIQNRRLNGVEYQNSNPTIYVVPPATTTDDSSTNSNQ